MKTKISKPIVRAAVAAAVGGAAWAAVAGCAPDAYRRSADADVYRLLNDRKTRALGYDPQAVSEPVVKPTTQPNNTEAAPAAGSTGSSDPYADRNRRIEQEPAAPPAKRAYAPIPLTAVPPMEPAGLDVKPAEPWQVLGPPVDAPPASAPLSRLDPFGADMSGKWSTDRLQVGPPAPRRRPLELDLFGALKYAVQHSRPYKNQMDELYLAALDVTLERHLLSPRPFAGGGLDYAGGQRDADYRSALDATANVGVRQRLPYGGEVVARALVGFVNALDDNSADGETASLVLSGSVPLLRGAGMVNLEALISSERELVYQVRAFEEFRRAFTIDVAAQYFQLLASYQSVNNRRANVTNAVSLLERTRAIYSANLGAGGGAGGRALRLTFLEVQRSEQQLLDAQNQLIDSQEAYLNDLDDFKLLLGIDVAQDIEIVPVALEVSVPDLEARDPLALATRYRLDLQTARDRIDDARRQVAISENGLLPDLNLTGTAALGNRGDRVREIDSRGLTYAAGLSLDLPIDRVAERNQYRAALIAFHRSQRAYDDTQDRVAADVRAAVRAIRSAEVSVQIQRRSIELAARRLENSNLLLKRGETNARDVVESQQALLRSQDSYERARADLQVQVLQFLRRTGTMRIDPDSGTIGRALDRATAGTATVPPGRG